VAWLPLPLLWDEKPLPGQQWEQSGTKLHINQGEPRKEKSITRGHPTRW